MSSPVRQAAGSPQGLPASGLSPKSECLKALQ